MQKVRVLYHQANLGKAFKKKDIAALKVHVGEPGTKTFLQPKVARALVRLMKESGARPFLTDSSVLYKSPRDDGVSHTVVAVSNGFGYANVGAPFIPADGILGKDEAMIQVFGKHYEEVSIASAIIQARSMLVLSHATGHLGIGFGGALKNLGMGCSSKKAKLSQHHGQQPKIKPNACTACGTCAESCPSDAISVDDVAVIDCDKCIGCGECIAVCQDDAVEFDWSLMGRELSERIVEHAAAVIRQKKGAVCFVTAAWDITKDCDCLGLNQRPLLPDIGLMASFDPVALDQAVYDLIVENAGRTLESMSYPKREGAYQMQYAEKLGIGTTRYELVELTL
jgi:uncharacterized Fe-S center protein